MFKELVTSSLPKYALVNPRTNTKYWFRPMLVREEKKMLAAQVLATKEEIIKCVEEILNSCFENLDSSKLPTFEFDYFFVNLRMKSISESISAKFTCPDTDEKVNLNIDLNSIKIKNIEKCNPTVKISDDLVITFRFPTYKDTLLIKNENDYDDVLNLATACVVSVTTPDQVHDITASNREDIKEMFLNMKVTQFSKIVEFFDSIPTYQHVYEYTTSDGVERKVVISGIEDFFTLASVI